MKHQFLKILLVTLFYIVPIHSQISTLESKIDDLVPSHVNDTTPGLVVGVVQNGKLIFSKGYGLANMSYNIPNDPKMVYNIGSVTKQFLGYAFAMLHVEGKINVDNPVNMYLKDWPEFRHQVTVRHLLTHTSGYREAYTMSMLSGRDIGIDRLSREECLEVVRKQPELEFVPGSSFTYNSTAWVILAEIFENVVGESTEKWIDANIFSPLDMKNTQIETYVGEVIDNAAESYSYNNQGYTNQKSNRAIFGAADIYTSIEDLTKWVNNYRTAEIANSEVNALFLDPFILNDGTNSGYAFGIGIDSYKGLKRYRHTGGHEAFVTQLSYYPDQDTGIIVISNFGGSASIFTTKIADILLKEHMSTQEKALATPFTPKKEVLEKLEGLYIKSTFNQAVNLLVEDEFLTINGQTKLIPVQPFTFRVEDSDDEVNFESNTEGNYELTLKSSNSLETYNKATAWNEDTQNLNDYEGDYWSDELETVYHITLKDNSLNVQHRWLKNTTLKPISKDFFASNSGFYVKFNRNQEGDLSGLSINSGRTLNVVFNRM